MTSLATVRLRARLKDFDSIKLNLKKNNIHSIQGSRFPQVRGVLNEVFDMNMRRRNDHYEDREDR